MEPTSEQELKQLLEEGKISEEEYQDLLEAIRQKEITPKTTSKPETPKSGTGYGRTALILFIVSVILPVVPIVLSIVLKSLFVLPLILLGGVCGLLSFIFGIIGWKSLSGKIATIGVPCLGLLAVPGILLLYFFSHRAIQVPEPEPYARPAAVALIHQEFPLDSMDGVLTRYGVEYDLGISFDGNGSLRVKANSSGKTTVRLFETGPMEIENQILFYSAKIKSDLENGKAYLEMWCEIPGKGEFFSRSVEQPIAEMTDWTTVQTPFRLETSQRPDNVKLNLVINGTGTVWIDDIKLTSSPLN